MNVMLNKYYVYIETYNNINEYTFYSLLNEQQLQKQLQHIYVKRYRYFYIEFYNVNDENKIYTLYLHNNVLLY